MIALAVGFYLGHLLASDNATTNYGCNTIARFHQDLLVRKYNIDFNTDQDNPRRDINQRASDLNSKLLGICITDPTK
ncbi:hypothetical protein A2769_00715 [Candidatus Daviesbacteria bacterium RIFCSPHIGHO2_01_FULL_37_27]|nr:MAG: hypothetical protein A2769_00715 [Candidatus Daviesbacteria bacterium RIFCSPHIGHO2_01_FULL_37_27]